MNSASRTIALRKSGGEWSLDGAPADSSAVARMLELYRSFDAMGFATDSQADALRKARQLARVRLRSKSGSPLLDMTFDGTASSARARADSGGPVFKIDSYQLAQLTPAESTLKAKKPAKKSRSEGEADDGAQKRRPRITFPTK